MLTRRTLLGSVLAAIPLPFLKSIPTKKLREPQELDDYYAERIQFHVNTVMAVHVKGQERSLSHYLRTNGNISHLVTCLTKAPGGFSRVNTPIDIDVHRESVVLSLIDRGAYKIDRAIAIKYGQVFEHQQIALYNRGR